MRLAALTVLLAFFLTVGTPSVGTNAAGPSAPPRPDLPHAPVCPRDIPVPGETYCHARVVTDRGGTPSVSTSPVGYSPQQLATAYSLSGITSGKTIAIVDA